MGTIDSAFPFALYFFPDPALVFHPIHQIFGQNDTHTALIPLFQGLVPRADVNIKWIKRNAFILKGQNQGIGLGDNMKRDM